MKDQDMDWSDGFTVIESMKRIRPEDIVFVQKEVQDANQNKQLLHWFRSQEKAAQVWFIQEAVKCYLHVLSSAKLAREFFKVLMSLPREYQEKVEKELELSFVHLVSDISSDNSIKTLCELLNQNNIAKDMCKKIIVPSSKLVVERLKIFTSLSNEQIGPQDLDTAYYTIKICIHCLQVCGKILKQHLFTDVDVSSDELRSLWSRILDSLLSVLFQNSKQDILGLVGTAIAMTLNLAGSLAESTTAYKHIFSMIFTEKKIFSFLCCSFTKPGVTMSCEDQNIRASMLIKGLLLTCNKELLSCHGSQSLLLHTFPMIVRACRGSQIHHYIAFQVLALWFQKLKHVEIENLILQTDTVNENEEESEHLYNDTPINIAMEYSSESYQLYDCKHLMSLNCPILSSTLSTIWLNWDNPVDGVPEYVVSIFDCFLNIWSQAINDGISKYHHLSSQLIQRVLMMSWYNKTRYRPLCILLPFVDIFQLLEDHPGLKEDLMKCMSINSLAAVASDVYKAFLTQMCSQTEAKKNDVMSSWCTIWMPILISGMTSSNHVQRLKMCTYWIPHSLKIIQGSENALLLTLEQRMKTDHNSKRIPNLLAWTTVCRYARDLLGLSLQQHHYRYIQEASMCMEEEVRSEVLFLLCNTLRRAAPVLEMEIQLLKSFIVVNLKTDSTSFRQNMISALKKVIIRLRDSCLSDVKSNTSPSDFVMNSIDFIDWLFKTLLQSLYPGGSYQCRQTTLDLLQAILHLLVYQEGHYNKKGKAQEGASILMEYANRIGKWNFFNLEHFWVLLSCLEDGAEDIQTQCYKLLVDYFPWPSSLQWGDAQLKKGTCLPDTTTSSLMTTLTHEKTVYDLMNRALDLASSPKSFENHNGLLLMSFVLKVFVENIGLHFKYDSNSRFAIEFMSEKSNMKIDPPSAYFDTLLQLLERSVSTAKEDSAKQFKHQPIHGLTQYVTECLKEVWNHFEEDMAWRKRLERLTDLNKEIISLILDVLSGGSSLEQCPSFAEMGIALENLISQDENQEDMASLSPDFQLLLSWCWINLKESCSSLGQVTASSMKTETSSLSSSVISDIGQVFVRVLTTCRHRGAIEGCRSGFSQFCEVLLSSKVEEFSSIPTSILGEIIQSLSTNSLSASISRRSAGIPIIVEIVTDQAIRTGKGKAFLTTTVDELYSIASRPLPSDHSQQKDLSQVHALNILKAVFCHANLASHLGIYLSKLTILVIENFDSPSWAIRNAATQLISTLVMRIFGQRSKNSGGLSLEEFNSLHPDLVDYILHKLQTFSSSINPSLYVLLTLLSNLVMSPSHLHNLECRKSLQLSLSHYLQNPVHSLRNLSSQAYVALFELDKADNKLRELLGSLKQNRKNLNVLHGCLLCVDHLISSEALSKSMYQESILFFCDNQELLIHSSTCFLPSTEVVVILHKLLHGFSGELSKQTMCMLWSQLEFLISRLCHSSSVVQAGAAHCMTECFRTMTLLASRCQDLHAAMVKFICSAMISLVKDLTESIISVLSHETLGEYLNSSVQETIWVNLIKETSVSIIVQSCDILYQLHDKYGQLSVLPKGFASLNKEELHKKWSHVGSVKSSILMLEGILYHDLESSDLLHRHDTIQLWCDQVVHFGSPLMNENSRLSSARALRKGGGNILSFYKQNHSNVTMGNVVVSIIKATVQFLEDSENNVRNEASIFVSDLMGLPHLHANLALQILSQYISQHLWWSDRIHKYLLDQLFSVGDLAAACDRAFSSESQRLFEPEMESILSEFHAKKLWAFQTLQAIPEGERTKMSTASKASEELCGNFSKLADDIQGNPFFNVSNNPRVMASLLGIILLDKLCQDENSGLVTDLQSLLQMPHLHPLLKIVSLDVNTTGLIQINPSACEQGKLE